MQLEVGQILDGKITGTTNFGVFVDIGDGKSGMVHISEVSRTFVTDISTFVAVGSTVKVKVLGIGEDGKISLSMKRALPDDKPKRDFRPRKNTSSEVQYDNSFVWTPQKSESSSFEDMMSKFKQTSDEKFSDLKRKNPDAHRTKRGAKQI